MSFRDAPGWECPGPVDGPGEEDLAPPVGLVFWMGYGEWLIRRTMLMPSEYSMVMAP